MPNVPRLGQRSTPPRWADLMAGEIAQVAKSDGVLQDINDQATIVIAKLSAQRSF
jgi:hypothetical protein